MISWFFRAIVGLLLVGALLFFFTFSIEDGTVVIRARPDDDKAKIRETLEGVQKGISEDGEVRIPISDEAKETAEELKQDAKQAAKDAAHEAADEAVEAASDKATDELEDVLDEAADKATEAKDAAHEHTDGLDSGALEDIIEEAQ